MLCFVKPFLHGVCLGRFNFCLVGACVCDFAFCIIGGRGGKLNWDAVYMYVYSRCRHI